MTGTRERDSQDEDAIFGADVDVDIERTARPARSRGEQLLRDCLSNG